MNDIKLFELSDFPQHPAPAQNSGMSPEERAAFLKSFRGERKDGVSPAFMAAATAVAVGIDSMTSNSVTIGSAIGTVAGALGSGLFADMIDATPTEAVLIGGVGGKLGVLAGNEIDARVSKPAKAIGRDDQNWFGITKR